jgi:hypothetical protein
LPGCAGTGPRRDQEHADHDRRGNRTAFHETSPALDQLDFRARRGRVEQVLANVHRDILLGLAHHVFQVSVETMQPVVASWSTHDLAWRRWLRFIHA